MACYHACSSGIHTTHLYSYAKLSNCHTRPQAPDLAERLIQLRSAAQSALVGNAENYERAFGIWLGHLHPNELRQPRKFFKRWAGRSSPADAARSGRPRIIDNAHAQQLKAELQRGAPDGAAGFAGFINVADARERSAPFRAVVARLPRGASDATILRAVRHADSDFKMVPERCKREYNPSQRARRCKDVSALLRLAKRGVLQCTDFMDEGSWGPAEALKRTTMVMGSKGEVERLREDTRAPKSNTDITPLHFSVTVNWAQGAAHLLWLKGPHIKKTYLVRGVRRLQPQRRRRIAPALQQVGRLVGGCVHDEGLAGVLRALGRCNPQMPLKQPCIGVMHTQHRQSLLPACHVLACIAPLLQRSTFSLKVLLPINLHTQAQAWEIEIHGPILFSQHPALVCPPLCASAQHPCSEQGMLACLPILGTEWAVQRLPVGVRCLDGDESVVLQAVSTHHAPRGGICPASGYAALPSTMQSSSHILTQCLFLPPHMHACADEEGHSVQGAVH